MAKRASKQKARLRVGIDLGGTKILAAVVDPDNQIVGSAKLATKPALGPDGVIERIVDATRQAISQAEVQPADVLAAAIGAPGTVDGNSGTVYEPPNLDGWGAVDLGPRLKAALGFPVFVDNDVNLGTLGEFELGAGQGARDMVGIFVGTGIGGGVIADGRLHRGFRQAAGELGHAILVPGGPLCGCGRQGCVEALASRTAIERDVRAALAAGRPSLVGELLASSKRDRLTSGIIGRALAEGDPLMTEVIGQAQFYLGLLTANIVNLLDPEVIVFGGGVVEELGEAFLRPVRATALPNFKQQEGAELVRILPAKLGDQAGVLGAAILAGQRAAQENRS